MSNQKICVVARIVATCEKVDEVKAILIGLIEPTRKEEGCIKYELLQNQAQPTDFTFIEEWTTETALNTHLASAHIAAASDKLDQLVAGEPDIRLYQWVET
jgi:quinol monooxygenase YgiN